MENKELNCNTEEHRQAYIRDCQKLKKFFSNKNNLFITIFVLIVIVTLAVKQKTPLEIFRTDNINQEGNVGIDIKGVDKANEEKIKSEALNIISDVFGDHRINFIGQDLKLKGFFNPEDHVMSIYYSSDILSYQAEHEISIFQYENDISSLELFEGEVLRLVQSFYDPKYIKSYKNDNSYFIVFSELNSNSSLAELSLVKIFEEGDRIYKINYNKNINNDALRVSREWVDKDYQNYLDEIKSIDLSYVQDIFNESLSIKNKLSNNNIYKDIKWETKSIKEDGAYARIDLSYPEFKGFSSANNLNKIITNIVLGALEEDRRFIEKWKKDEKNSYTDNEGNIVSDCYGDQDYFYSCSVNLHSSFKVKSILNNIISLEIILTDYTGGGNGNHSYVKTIIYDLKNGKQLFIDDLFCGDNYLERVKEILKSNIAIGYVYDNNIKDLSDEELLSYLREVSFNGIGLTLSFNPYIFAPDIYNIFVPYAILEDNLCFKDGGNNDILIRRSLLNLDVPVELSDSCGFDKCDGFSFYKGVFNDMDSRNYSRDYASIHISIEDYKTGYLLNNGKREKIVVVPYVWQWASTGINLYVLKIDNDSLIPLSRIPVGKGMPQNLKIEDNKIFFSYINLDDSIISRECYFKDNIIKESNLICSQSF